MSPAAKSGISRYPERSATPAQAQPLTRARATTMTSPFQTAAAPRAAMAGARLSRDQALMRTAGTSRWPARTTQGATGQEASGPPSNQAWRAGSATARVAIQPPMR